MSVLFELKLPGIPIYCMRAWRKTKVSIKRPYSRWINLLEESKLKGLIEIVLKKY
jgi:hypothetical protein